MAGSFVEDHPGGSQRAMPAGITLPAARRAARQRAGVPFRKRLTPATAAALTPPHALTWVKR